MTDHKVRAQQWLTEQFGPGYGDLHPDVISLAAAFAAVEQAAVADTATNIRLAMATRLASDYRNDPLRIAKLCDEILDPSGRLLGVVREKALRASGPAPVKE